MNYITLMLGVALLISALYLKPRYLYIVLGAGVFYAFFWLNSANILFYLLFLIGMALFIVELYIPGFGVVGILGITATTLALYNVTLDGLETIVLVSTMLITALMTGYILSKLGKELTLSPKLILNTSLENAMSGHDYSDLDHQLGTSLTALRPIGRAEIKGEIYDVISEIGMIEANTQIKVRKIEGTKIYVQKEN